MIKTTATTAASIKRLGGATYLKVAQVARAVTTTPRTYTTATMISPGVRSHGFVRPSGEHAFDEGDRRADAPDDVESQHVYRPWHGDAKSGYVAGAQ